MDVRELITELLDRDLDAHVEISIESEQENEDFDFEINESSWGGNSYVNLVVKPKGYALVDNSDYEDMQKKIDELEAKLEEFEEK